MHMENDFHLADRNNMNKDKVTIHDVARAGYSFQGFKQFRPPGEAGVKGEDPSCFQAVRIYPESSGQEPEE